MPLNRRNVLMLGGLAGLAASWQIWGVRPAVPDLRPIATAPGWSFAMAGQISGAIDPALIGIQSPDAPDLPAFTPAGLEQAVFKDTRRAGHVPMAVFSDYFCPYCRVLFARLSALQRTAGTPLTIAWHELPLLRPASHIAARAAEAADLQGGYVPFQTALIEQGFRPAPAALARLATSAGLNGARLMQDMNGAEVAARLHSSARAAAQLGVFATPGLVIGRTVFLGALQPDAMDFVLKRTALHSA